MADEINVQGSLQVNNSNLVWRSSPSGFLVDQTTAAGPSPGYVLATTAGVTVDLSALTTPALVMIQNLDGTNFVEFGPYSGGTFYELGELLAGEHYVLRLSRNMAALRLKANTANCGCIVECFDA
jgi:hypothetical protein